jgi:hypothetical protein
MGARAARSTTALAALALALLLAGCGSSNTGAKGPPAERVCNAARRAAAGALGAAVRVTITDKDPTNIECRLEGRGVGLAITARASAQAFTAYDTEMTHFEQALGAAGQTQHPQSLPGLGTVASWVPSQRELLATNGSQFRGGNFLTVAVTRWSSPGQSPLAVAQAVAKRALPLAPRGPKPGAPPS